MRLSANLGLPIGELDDARRDFPLMVDGPRTDALDGIIVRNPAREYVLIKTAANTAALPSGISKIPAATIVTARGVNASAQSGHITINTSGTYLFGAAMVLTSIAANMNHGPQIIETDAGGVQVAPGGLYNNIGGLNIAAAITTSQPSSSFCKDIVAGHQLHLGVYCAAAGAIVLADSYLWAARIG